MPPGDASLPTNARLAIQMLENVIEFGDIESWWDGIGGGIVEDVYFSGQPILKRLMRELDRTGGMNDAKRYVCALALALNVTGRL